LWVVYQVAGVNLEKAGQQHARGIRQVRAHAVFYLREVRLADVLLQFLPERANDLLLGHLAIEAAERAFHGAEVADFFSQAHIYLILQCQYNVLRCTSSSPESGLFSSV